MMRHPETPIGTPQIDNTLRHVVTAALYTIVTVILLGLIYPVLIWAIATVLFHHQAAGSLIEVDGTVIGSELVGQAFKKPQYFHPRPSAAGKDGYDPTATGGTNDGPTSKKLIDGAKAAVGALKKENPQSATLPIPADLVTSSASGIDPDISPQGAEYQVVRVATARHLTPDAVREIVALHTRGRDLGILGEPRVNVLEVNRALDAQGTVK